jgi:hypothetical protein
MDRGKAFKERARARSVLKTKTWELLTGPAQGKTIPARWRSHYKRLVELHASFLERRQELNKDALE